MSSGRPRRAVVGVSVKSDDEVARRTTSYTEASESSTYDGDGSNAPHVENVEIESLVEAGDGDIYRAGIGNIMETDGEECFVL